MALHVAQLAPSYLPILGGKESHIYNLAVGLPSVRFTVVASQLWAGRIPEVTLPNLQIRRIGPPDLFQGRWSLPAPPLVELSISGAASLVRLARQRRLIERSAVNLVHSHWAEVGFIDALKAIASEECRKRFLEKALRLVTFKTPTVFTDHSMFVQPMSKAELLFLQYALANYAAVVCVEEGGAARAAAISRSIGGSARIVYIPNSVDCEAFRPSDEDKRHPPTVCFVGRANKSHALVIELCRRMRDVRFLLVVAGDRRSLRKWRSVQSERLRLYENVLPWDLPPLIREADVLLNPILYDGISRVTLEGLATGVPVVSAQGISRYPLIDGKTGLLVPATPTDFEKAIRSLLGDSATGHGFGRTGRGLIEREFSNSVVLPKLARLYDEVAISAAV